MLAAIAHESQACPKPTVAVAPSEPYVTRGPTEVVVGIYVQGGALRPGCGGAPVYGPDGGTVTLRAASGRVVARQTLRGTGQLFVLHVAAGRYTISARRAGGVTLAPVAVTVRRGRTVRRDVFEDVP